MDKVLVIQCIDYRFQSNLNKWITENFNNYDLLSIAGSSLSLTIDNENTNNWKKTIKEHILVSYKLHNISKIILIDHEDCGAYKTFLNLKNDIGYENHIKHLKEAKLLITEFLNTKKICIDIELYVMLLNNEIVKIS